SPPAGRFRARPPASYCARARGAWLPPVTTEEREFARRRRPPPRRRARRSNGHETFHDLPSSPTARRSAEADDREIRPSRVRARHSNARLRRDESALRSTGVKSRPTEEASSKLLGPTGRKDSRNPSSVKIFPSRTSTCFCDISISPESCITGAVPRRGDRQGDRNSQAVKELAASWSTGA